MLQEYLLASSLSPAIAKSQQEYLVDDLLILVLANEDSSLRCHCTLREWCARASQNRAANSRCAEPAKILAFLPPQELCRLAMRAVWGRSTRPYAVRHYPEVVTHSIRESTCTL